MQFFATFVVVISFGLSAVLAGSGKQNKQINGKTNNNWAFEIETKTKSYKTITK